MAWNEETKKQAHWKCGDITDRKVTRADMSGSRGALAKRIHNDITAKVMRVDMENACGSKTIVNWTQGD